MKKMLAILLAVVMVSSFAVMGSAATTEDDLQAQGVALFEEYVDALQNRVFSIGTEMVLFGRTQRVGISARGEDLSTSQMDVDWHDVMGDGVWRSIVASLAQSVFGSHARLMVLGGRAALEVNWGRIDIAGNSDFVNNVRAQIAAVPTIALPELPAGTNLADVLETTQPFLDQLRVAFAHEGETITLYFTRFWQGQQWGRWWLTGVAAAGETTAIEYLSPGVNPGDFIRGRRIPIRVSF